MLVGLRAGRLGRLAFILEPVVTPELAGIIVAVDDSHISYALERLIRAVDSLMTRRGDVRSRLRSAFVFVQPIDPDNLPEPFRREPEVGFRKPLGGWRHRHYAVLHDGQHCYEDR